MNDDVREILEKLRDERDRWEGLLSGLDADDIAASRLPNGWSIKDLVAHLMAWQQVTLARLEAARQGASPVLPGWLAGGDPESDDDVHRFNARILEAYRERSWPQVHEAWRDGFSRVLALAEEIPADDLVRPGRYPWLDGGSLVTVLHGTFDHHHDDHLGPLLRWTLEHGRRASGGAAR